MNKQVLLISVLAPTHIKLKMVILLFGIAVLRQSILHLKQVLKLLVRDALGSFLPDHFGLSLRWVDVQFDDQIVEFKETKLFKIINFVVFKSSLEGF